MRPFRIRLPACAVRWLGQANRLPHLLLLTALCGSAQDFDLLIRFAPASRAIHATAPGLSSGGGFVAARKGKKNRPLKKAGQPRPPLPESK